MTSARLFLLTVFFASSAFAQQLHHSLMASRNDARPMPRTSAAGVDTVSILAVMVQFQPDNDIGTTGNGQFDLSTPSDPGLDAPPHDRQYFLDHLTFLRNYYARVSKGKVLIQATVVDSVFTLPQQMARYSPPKNGPNTALGDLARDTWQKVDSSGLVPDFSAYNCFIVFHAGVGRDIDLVSILGYDPTPRDIPSLYLGLNALKEFYGTGYEGIPVRNGFKITNTIIMPETETRDIPSTPQNVLLRLGINGLLCASVGNFLGLPDLFDTNTGRSGIGRFGLMDGQAIFSFAGAFPPEPSAWEKYWLGWIDPIVLGSGEHTIQLPAVALADTAYRIPISSSEYYLVENRNRDARRDGARVTSSYGGVIRQQTFARDTTGFAAFDVSAIRGNVLDVDEWDWSLPGGVSRSGIFYDGGILIWHIDENVIAQGLRTNGVNANPNRRGVDLEEADGSQDIGQAYGQFDPGSGSEEGTALDFWYQGNESPVYRNEFSSTSYPNTASNSGANSHVTIKEFSARGPRMTARVMVGDVVSLLPGFPKQGSSQLTSPSITVASVGSPDSVVAFVATTTSPAVRPTRVPFQTSGLSGELYAWRRDGRPLFGNGLFARAGGPFPLPGGSFVGAPAVADIGGDGLSEVAIAEANSSGGVLHLYQTVPSPLDSLARELIAQRVARRPTTSPLITDSLIAFGASQATVYTMTVNGYRLDSIAIPGDTSDVVGLAAVNATTGIMFTTAAGRIGTTLAFISPQAVGSGPPSLAAGSPVVGRLNERHPLVVVSALANGRVYVYDVQGGLSLLPGFPINVGEAIVGSPALADVDGDGNRDVVFFAGKNIYAYNYAGASLDNFPKLILAPKPISSSPVIADVDGDGLVDIVAVSEDGLVVAYNKNGAMARGFPLQAGTGRHSVAAFSVAVGSSGDVALAVASSDDGSVVGWQTARVAANGPARLPWPQYQHDARHLGLAIEPLSGTPLTTSFFPKERAYNWPNPVYDGRTFIRYFVSENATVKIKIFDVAGDVVTEFNGPGIGGVDNEVEWDVSGVQSGVYLARIEASSGGKSDVAIVKVAVVK
jgi:hypothetical protein